MKPLRVVLRIEISTLCDLNNKFDQQKMDRLAMLISNMNNSGMEVLLVSSGAIVLGADKLRLAMPEDQLSMQALAAVGQAELIKFYQKYFDQYNQMAAQVLLSSDIFDNANRVFNTQNTFDTLLKMNILPIINENDPVSTTDIELDDNYPLALNVAKITKADAIIIKTDDDNYILTVKGKKSVLLHTEDEMLSKLDVIDKEKDVDHNEFFPTSISELKFEPV